jgi:hypothetical protein
MNIEKEIISKRLVDYLFLSGTVDIDSEYFIKRIEEGIKDNNALSYLTNVKGEHTSFEYFVEDKKFNDFILEIIDYLERLKFEFKPYQLMEAWGLKIGYSNYTQIHDHAGSFLSGSLYLNEHNQELIFPEIEKSIIPKKGQFVLFSSDLKHYTKRNLSEKNKYGIAFNFLPKGILSK